MDGIQLFIEIIDTDSGLGEVDGDELIDRFAINIATSPGSTIAIETYEGLFGLAQIDASIIVQCADNFYGPRCDIFCKEVCNCEPEIRQQFPECSDSSTTGCSSSFCSGSIITVAVMNCHFLLVFMLSSVIVIWCVKKRLDQFALLLNNRGHQDIQ